MISSDFAHNVETIVSFYKYLYDESQNMATSIDRLLIVYRCEKSEARVYY
jgi:hypothetical protein